MYLCHCLGVIAPITSFAAVAASRGCLALVVSVLVISDCSLCFAFDSGGSMRPPLRPSMHLKSMY